MRQFAVVLLLISLVSSSCRKLMAQTPQANELVSKIKQELTKNEGTFAIAFKDAITGEQILINEREKFHAASTMKDAGHDRGIQTGRGTQIQPH